MGKYSELAPAEGNSGKTSPTTRGYLVFVVPGAPGRSPSWSKSFNTSNRVSIRFGWDQLGTDGTRKCSAKMRCCHCCQMFFSLSWRQWVYYHLPGPEAFHQVWTCQGAGNWSGSGIECFSLETHATCELWCVQRRFDSKHAGPKVKQKQWLENTWTQYPTAVNVCAMELPQSCDKTKWTHVVARRTCRKTIAPSLAY